MKATKSIPQNLFRIVLLVLLAACEPPPPTPIAQEIIQITQISSDNIVTGQIVQTKTFDRCNAAGDFAAEVKFGESSSETTQKALTLTVGTGAEADIPAVAKAKVEAAVEEHFSFASETVKSHEEGVKIEVPAHTRQEYTIVWKETRDEGTVEYTVNGDPKIANYSYRVGLEFETAIGRDIDWSLPTTTPMPTSTPESPTVLITATPQPKTLMESCIFSRTWKPDSQERALADAVSIGSDGCYAMDELGMFANAGTLHLSKETGNSTAAFGIYTPVNDNSVIEFNVHVNEMSMRFNNIAEITLAVTPANDRLTAKSTARFKLHLEEAGIGKIIHFMMADVGENAGVKLGTQHYEYGRTYNIRLLLSVNQMDVFINGYRINESLEIPTGSKTFYIGYTIPVYTKMDIELSNITVDGLPK